MHQLKVSVSTLRNLHRHCRLSYWAHGLLLQVKFVFWSLEQMTISLSRLTHANCSHDSLQLFAEQDDVPRTTIERCVAVSEAKAACLVTNKVSNEQSFGFADNRSRVRSRVGIFA